MNKKQMLLCLLGTGMMWTPSTAFADITRNVSTTSIAAPDKHELKGTVSDDMGPVMGATIKIVGTTQGTVTDLDGNFYH